MALVQAFLRVAPLVVASGAGRWLAVNGGAVAFHIETESLTKYYGRQRGVDELTLAVGPGEVFGLLGPNGAGRDDDDPAADGSDPADARERPGTSVRPAAGCGGGHLAVVDRIAELKARALRVLDLDFATPQPPEPFERVAGVRAVSAHGTLVRCEVVGPVGDLMRLAAGQGLVDVTSHEPDLEQIFVSYAMRSA